jgi:hypothetical protein
MTEVSAAAEFADKATGLDDEQLAKAARLLNLSDLAESADAPQFLAIAREKYPQRLMAEKAIGPQARRSAMLRREARRLRGLAESEQEACERVEQSLAEEAEYRSERGNGSSQEVGSSEEEEEEGEEAEAEDGAEEVTEAEMRATEQSLGGEEAAAAAARSRSAAPFPGPSSSWGASSASPLCPRVVARPAAFTPTHTLLPRELAFPAARRTPSQAGLLALCLATGRLHVLGAAARALAPSQAKAIGRQLQAAAAGCGGGKGGRADCAAVPTEQPPPALYGGPVPSCVFSLRPGAAEAGGGASRNGAGAGHAGPQD